MNTLTVRKLTEQDIKAENLSARMDKEAVAFHAIGQVNWETYPYCPKVRFRIAHTDSAILINYQVEEQSVRAKYGEDNDSVWTDSCAEFFVIPANDDIYYNIESNCIGTVLVGAGKDRNDRERAPQPLMDGIERWASLGNTPFGERIGQCCWELSLIIPYSVFFKHHITSMDGITVKGNFYKCGDELQTPHFVSWNKIEVEKPDFHRPDFFGTLFFE